MGLVCSGAISWKFASDTMVRRHAGHLWERLDDEGDGLKGECQSVDIIGQKWLPFRSIYLFLGFAVLKSFFSLSLLSERFLLSSWWQPGAPSHSERLSSSVRYVDWLASPSRRRHLVFPNQLGVQDASCEVEQPKLEAGCEHTLAEPRVFPVQ